jgi:hypothetical protein
MQRCRFWIRFLATAPELPDDVELSKPKVAKQLPTAWQMPVTLTGSACRPTRKSPSPLPAVSDFAHIR